MLELGDRSEEEHLKLLSSVKSINPDKVLLVGAHFRKASSGYDYPSFLNVTELGDYIRNNPIKESYILIKGSRGMTLEQIYDIL